MLVRRYEQKCRQVKVGVLYLHGDTKALVEGHEPSAADDLFEAVDEACELAGAGLAQVSCQPGTGKVQGVHNQQRSSSGQTTCTQRARTQHAATPQAVQMEPSCPHQHASGHYLLDLTS